MGCRKVYYYRLNNVGSATTKYDVRQSVGALYALEGIEKDLIIRTPYVMNALNQHIWINHFWNLRQILATNTKEENYELFQKSLCYTKYCLTGIFPVTAAKLKNLLFDLRLKVDVKRLVFYSNTIIPRSDSHLWFSDCEIFLNGCRADWRHSSGDFEKKAR